MMRTRQGLTEHFRWRFQFLTIFLLISFPLQSLIAPMMAQPAAPSGLRISILDGEGAINNIKQRTAREPIVQIEDENHKPVSGALVLFASPDRGPGLVFANGSKTAMVYTDSKGQAAARGIKPNQIAGTFEIKVTVSYQGLTAATVIHQSNIMPKAAGYSSGKLLAIAGAVGVVAAAGIIFIARKDNSFPAQPPTTVTIGNPTVGRP